MADPAPRPEPAAPKHPPATGTTDPEATHVQPIEEPNLTGTLFLTLLLLMGIFGFWILMYVELLNR